MAVQARAFSVHDYSDDPTKSIIRDGERFERLIRFLQSRRHLVFDYETSGTAWFQHAEAVGIGLGSWDDQGRFWSTYVPFRHQTGEQQLDINLIGPAIKQLLENPYTLKIGHNIKFEDHFSRKEGWSVEGPRYDTMVAARLYDENNFAKLEHRAADDLGYGQEAFERAKQMTRIVGKLAKQNKIKVSIYKNKYGYSEVPIEVCGYYCCHDLKYTGELYQFYERWGVSRNYPRIWPTEMSLTRDLCDTEQIGIPVDVPYLEGVRAQARSDKQNLENRITSALGGHTISLSSDDEMRDFLFNTLGCRWDKLTKAGKKKAIESRKQGVAFDPYPYLAVDASVLEHFSHQHSILSWVLEWRNHDKIESTYTTSILEKLDANNVVHGSLKQVGTNCLPAGELVLTQNGLVPVEQVVTGDLVLTHLGRGRPVIDAFENGVKPLAQVTLENGLVLNTTLNHPYLVGDRWVEAGDLVPGDKVRVYYTQKEEWRKVKGWPDFSVSSWGRIRNDVTGRLRKQSIKNRWGHLKVTLYRNGAQKRGPDKKDFSVHRLVALAFLPKPHPTQTEVRHLNGLAWDNSVQNLRWGTSLENSVDARLHGTHRRNHAKHAKLTVSDVDVIRATPFVRAEARLGRIGSDRELAKRFGVSRELIRDVRLGKKWRRYEGEPRQTAFSESRVQTIQFLPEELTYGLTVVEDQSHVTGGIVTHNTGRLSCEEPNYQNMPAGPLIRSAFQVRGKGWVRLFLDYSQIELRVLAFYSRDPRMVQVYLDNGDIHEATRLALEEASGREVPRRVAKVINFGLSYCLTAVGAAAQAGIPLDEAQKLMDDFFKKFSGIVGFRQELWALARRQKCQWNNIFGRTRRLPTLMNAPQWMVSRAERQLIGSAIQGTAAELTKASFVRIADYIRSRGLPAFIVNTVHDEIQIDCHKSCLTEVVLQAKRMMEDYPEFHPIPIVVEAEITETNWGEKISVSEWAKAHNHELAVHFH